MAFLLNPFLQLFCEAKIKSWGTWFCSSYFTSIGYLFCTCMGKAFIGDDLRGAPKDERRGTWFDLRVSSFSKVCIANGQWEDTKVFGYALLRAPTHKPDSPQNEIIHAWEAAPNMLTKYYASFASAVAVLIHWFKQQKIGMRSKIPMIFSVTKIDVIALAGKN